MAVPLSCKDLRPEAHALFRIWSRSIIAKTRTSRMTIQKIYDRTEMGWEEIRAISGELVDEGFLELREESCAVVLAPACNCPKVSGTTRASASDAPVCAHGRGIATKAIKGTTHSSGGVEHRRAGARRGNLSPEDFNLPVEEWAPKTFARYLAQQINRKYRWANGIGPRPVNFNAVAKNIRDWILGGTDPVVIKRMIELFAVDPRPYLRSGQPAWIGFVSSRQKLWEKALKSVRARQMIEHGDDRDFLEGKGAWAKPPTQAFGPEYDDRDVLEGRKR